MLSLGYNEYGEFMLHRSLHVSLSQFYVVFSLPRGRLGTHGKSRWLDYQPKYNADCFHKARRIYGVPPRAQTRQSMADEHASVRPHSFVLRIQKYLTCSV